MVVRLDERFTVPLYTPSAVARHLDIAAESILRWTKKPGLVTLVQPERATGGASIPFIGLAELQLYRNLRLEGLSLQAITAGMSNARKYLGDDLLKQGRLAHDAKELMINLGGSEGDEWTRARDGQGGLEGVIERSLTILEWSDSLPQRIRLSAYEGAKVVADPRYSSGRPIDAATGMRIEDIARLFKAGDSMQFIAEEYGVEHAVVEAAIRTMFDVAA